MGQLIRLILDHKDEFKIYNPLPAYEALVSFRECDSSLPSPEDMLDLCSNTMDLVIDHSELPQYLTFMALFHSDVFTRLSQDSRQEYDALARCFLMQFPRSAYVRIANRHPSTENDLLLDHYAEMYREEERRLAATSFDLSHLEKIIEVIYQAHVEYRAAINQAIPYFRSFFSAPGGFANAFMKAHDDGTLDKERYSKEMLLSHRYYKSVPYFLHGTDMRSYGKDFIGPYGLFYPIRSLSKDLIDKLSRDIYMPRWMGP